MEFDFGAVIVREKMSNNTSLKNLIKRIKYNINSKDLIPVIFLTAIKGK